MFQPKFLGQRLLIKRSLDFWKIIYNTFTAAGGPVIILWVLLPLMNKSKQLPLSFWYPYDTKNSPLFEITCLHQIMSFFFSVIAIFNIDMLVAALMVFIGTQCDILCDDLRNLHDNITASFSENLIKSIKHHQEILIFAERCNEYISFILLGQFLASSVILSFILYGLALVNVKVLFDDSLDVRFFAHVVLVVFYMIQIFTYCWFGNEVEVKSNKIPYSIFESDWTRHSLTNKQNMMMLIVKSQKPIRLSAYNLFYLSLEIYIK
ncbi:7tm 6 domain containing protein, partial [Asbolus verrucosus]